MQGYVPNSSWYCVEDASELSRSYSIISSHSVRFQGFTPYTEFHQVDTYRGPFTHFGQEQVFLRMYREISKSADGGKVEKPSRKKDF